MEQLLVEAKPIIIDFSFVSNLTSFDTFCTRAANLNVREMHTVRCNMPMIRDGFSLDKTFDFLQVNRPKLRLNLRIIRPINYRILAPTVRELLAFVEKMFHDKKFEHFIFTLMIRGEPLDPRSLFATKGYESTLDDEDDEELHYTLNK